MTRTGTAAALSSACFVLVMQPVHALDLQGLMDAASAAQGALRSLRTGRSEKKQTVQGQQAETQARDDAAAAATRASAPASSAEPAKGSPPTVDSATLAIYRFKTPLSESLGTADLTDGLLPIAPGDKRLSPAARSALTGILNSVALFTRNTPNDGLTMFNANRSLTDQERAQVIGIAVAELRSEARITDLSPETVRDIQNRTADGGRLVALFVKSVPDARNIHYVWMQPDDPAIRRRAIGNAGVQTPGRRMTGHLGDFLGSAFQHKNPNTDSGGTYRLYDERMSPQVLARVDEQLAGNEMSIWQKASSTGVPVSQDQSILDGYSGNATNVGGHVTEAAPKVSSGQEDPPKAKPTVVMDKNGKVVIDPATGRPLLRQPD